MKNEKLRFSIFCLIVALIICLPVSSPIFKTKYSSETKYYFFAKEVLCKSESAEYIKNGNAYIVCCNFDVASQVKNQLDGIMGESIRISKCSQKTKQQVFDEYEKYVVQHQKVDNYQIFLCYNPKIKDFIFVDNNKINIQISISDDEINIGYPLILNGF